MREFGDYGLKFCRYQGKLFEESLNLSGCSTPVFIRRFMMSKIAERMDREGFMFESLSEADAIAEIEEQYGKSVYGKIRYSRERKRNRKGGAADDRGSNYSSGVFAIRFPYEISSRDSRKKDGGTIQAFHRGKGEWCGWELT